MAMKISITGKGITAVSLIAHATKKMRGEDGGLANRGHRVVERDDCAEDEQRRDEALALVGVVAKDQRAVGVKNRRGDCALGRPATRRASA